MTSELKILCYEDIKTDLVTFFKRRSLIPIVGAGISCSSQAYNGNIPSGEKYKQHMLRELEANKSFSAEDKKELHEANFSTLCDYYEDDENINPERRFSYLKNNFYRSYFKDNDIRKRLFEINWPYIYSLNIDDLIENCTEYKYVILPKREFRDEIFEENKCLIKLHGDIREIVTYKDGSKIFTSKEYALSIEQNAPLLNKLKNDYSNQNILYIGCSLDDEIDLSALSGVPINFNAKSSLRKTLIFTKGRPSKLKVSKYKKYGITDIIIFNDYDSMYLSLIDSWEESQRIGEDEVIGYENIKILDIKGTDKKKNHDYFFWGKGLLDSKKLQMSYPYYFISRDIGIDIIKNLSKNKIHLVIGNRISGKSYLLSGLYREIRDRKVCYFDGRSKISNSAIKKLLNYTNTAIIFDVGSLSREQFEFLLNETKIIQKNKNNFIIGVNDNDSDIKGIVKYKLEIGCIKEHDVLSYNLKNKFNKSGKDSEKEEFNKRLPIISLPPYNANNTLLDHIIYAETILEVKSKFARHRIVIDNYKQLALLLILAIKEKMFSSEIIIFALDQEIIEAIRKYDPFIERVETLNYEKDSTDLSSLKYVLNSKYWLRRELGSYAQNIENYSTISDAYKYIIRKTIISAGCDKIKQRKKCKNYIMFDVLNEIFLNKAGGMLKLIVHIYEQLHEQLATDYNFLHQNAKCLVNYSYTLKNQNAKNKKESILLKAKDLAIISKSMIDQSYEESNNEHLLISIAHVQFTIASIMCNLCKIHEYSDMEEIKKTINILNVALNSSYNIDNKNNKRISSGILNFINDMYNKINNDNFYDEICRRDISNLINLINLPTHIIGINSIKS